MCTPGAHSPRRGSPARRYPLSVAAAGGAAWVASVENGFVYGTLTRIDERTRRPRVVWRRGDSSVQYVAAGAGGVWALIGAPGGAKVARFALDGRLMHLWSIPGAGRMAADDSGCWVSTDRALWHIDAAGRMRRVLRARLGDVATGAGAVWLPEASSVLRIDEHTGRVKVLRTGRLHLGGMQHDFAAGDGALWALTPGRLVRFDPDTGRRTGSAQLPGIADAIAFLPDGVLVATAVPGDIYRFDPRTLERTLFARIRP